MISQWLSTSIRIRISFFGWFIFFSFSVARCHFNCKDSNSDLPCTEDRCNSTTKFRSEEFPSSMISSTPNTSELKLSKIPFQDLSLDENQSSLSGRDFTDHSPSSYSSSNHRDLSSTVNSTAEVCDAEVQKDGSGGATSEEVSEDKDAYIVREKKKIITAEYTHVIKYTYADLVRLATAAASSGSQSKVAVLGQMRKASSGKLLHMHHDDGKAMSRNKFASRSLKNILKTLSPDARRKAEAKRAESARLPAFSPEASWSKGKNGIDLERLNKSDSASGNMYAMGSKSNTLRWNISVIPWCFHRNKRF